MSTDTVVDVQHISKKFSRNLRRSMYFGAIDVLKSMLNIETHTGVLRPNEFWAVNDVSFELKRGQSLGVIGPNGSGKSTLLRLLNGIYMPDRGRIEIQGRIGALISLGAGFHPLMTGRENIYLNGAILGLSKKQLNKQFDEIVAFAEIGEFLEAPVKTYSSGMYVRLGFAIAIHAHPDILLVDEVLSVGDANFQKKCFDKLLRLREKGTSLIFISHSMSAVERLCTECLLMKHGNQIFKGNTRECVQRYFHEISQDNLAQTPESVTVGVGDVVLSDVLVYQESGDKNNPNIEFGKNIIIEFKYEFLRKESSKNQVRVGIRTFEGRDVQKLYFQESAFIDGKIHANEIIHPLKKEGTVQVRILNPKLFPQTFRLDIAIAPLDMDVHLGAISNAAIFNVIHPAKESLYLEYGNMTVTQFDYDVNLF
jgi:lipopolysaccharide transport system ATP-binding protein